MVMDGLSNNLFKINCYTKRDQDIAGAAYCWVKLFELETLFLLYLWIIFGRPGLKITLILCK